MPYTLLLFLAFLFHPAPQAATVPKSIYDFKVEGLQGGIIDFSQFKGKKILIVNTASHCGYTPQYEGLEALYKNNKNTLVIVGFPSNNFMFQERGSNNEIAAFCKANYGVTFPMAAKIAVKGKKKAAIYQWLTDEKYNHFKSSKVEWNFQKYLIDEQGRLIAIFPPGTPPNDIKIISAIQSYGILCHKKNVDMFIWKPLVNDRNLPG